VDVPTQVYHESEGLERVLVDGVHAVEHEVGGEQEGEGENFDVDLLVPVARSEALRVDQDGVQFRVNLNGTTPHPEASGA